MAQTNRNVFPAVRATEVKPWLTPETMSPLGRELMKIAEEIEASDAAEMSEEDIEQELALRRGGYNRNGE
jgi:hypothetical protein